MPLLGSDARLLHRPCRPRGGGRRPDRLLRDGDKITIDAVVGTIDVALSDAELAERRRAWTARQNGYQSGTLWKYAQTVGDAENGAVTHPGARAETHVYADL